MKWWDLFTLISLMQNCRTLSAVLFVTVRSAEHRTHRISIRTRDGITVRPSPFTSATVCAVNGGMGLRMPLLPLFARRPRRSAFCAVPPPLRAEQPY